MKYATILSLLLILAAGCVNPPVAGRADPYPPHQINLNSKDLANKTAVGQPVMERRDGLLFVTVPIRSTVDQNLHIDYRITFLNENGAPIYHGSWEGGTVLVRNVPSYIRFNSTSANAADFQLDIRWAE
jgi:hypothetical protein